MSRARGARCRAACRFLEDARLVDGESDGGEGAHPDRAWIMGQQLGLPGACCTRY
jgi:hypothetical protein